jgi:hypothetical protein
MIKIQLKNLNLMIFYRFSLDIKVFKKKVDLFGYPIYEIFVRKGFNLLKKTMKMNKSF